MTNEANSESTNETAGPSKKSSKKILLLGLGLLLLAAGGGIGWHFLAGKATAAKDPATPALAIVPLAHFIVNLADTDRNAYLRVGIDLGVDKPKKKETGGDNKNAMPIPEVRDAILAVLTTYHSSDLLTPQGKTQLKENLIEALKRKAPGLGVREIYFTDFLVQR